MTSGPSISIVVPVHNEADNITPLINDIVGVMADGLKYEIIVVDDASTDGSRRIIQAIVKQYRHCRLLCNPVQAGQSAAVHSGVLAARGPLVCTLDGDGQNPPSELPRLLAPLLDPARPEALGMVAGQRRERRDTPSKRLASLFANGLRSRVLNDGTRDTGCGLKAFRRDAFVALPYFDHMHRFLPALFQRDGWKVAHVEVGHLPRKTGNSNYSNLQRAWAGVIDLVGVCWLLRRGKATRAEEYRPS